MSIEILCVDFSSDTKSSDLYLDHIQKSARSKSKTTGKFPINLTWRRFDELEGYIGNNDMVITDHVLQCMKLFDHVDIILLCGDMTIIPWDYRFHNLLCLIKLATITHKVFVPLPFLFSFCLVPYC